MRRKECDLTAKHVGMVNADRVLGQELGLTLGKVQNLALK